MPAGTAGRGRVGGVHRGAVSCGQPWSAEGKAFLAAGRFHGGTNAGSRRDAAVPGGPEQHSTRFSAPTSARGAAASPPAMLGLRGDGPSAFLEWSWRVSRPRGGARCALDGA